MKLRLGELFVLGFQGQVVPRWMNEFAHRFGLGAVILFDYSVQTKSYGNNVTGPSQLKSLCSSIHALATRPLVCVDHEGGKVRRLKENLGFAPLPSAHDFANLPTHEAKAILQKSFIEMRSCGIDWNWGPVVDLNTNPQNPDIGKVFRSFSIDPKVVQRCAELWFEVAQQAGLHLCLKHYPGLGGATVNSHEELTDLSGTVSQEQLDLFDRLLRKMNHPVVLLSHGQLHEWQTNGPVSTSPKAVNRVRAMTPEALLITDDLQMQGLQKMMSTEEATVKALRAGVDMICIGNNLLPEEDRMISLLESLERNIAGDPDLLSSVMRSLQRVRALKLSNFANLPQMNT